MVDLGYIAIFATVVGSEFPKTNSKGVGRISCDYLLLYQLFKHDIVLSN